MKTCTTCKQEKELSEFGKGKNYPGGLNYRCLACCRFSSARFKRDNPTKVLEYTYQRRYGISIAQKHAMVMAVGAKCESCGSSNSGKPKSDPVMGFCVDHDHATGKIRGILCVHCNAALGQLKNSPDVIVRLLNYANERCK